MRIKKILLTLLLSTIIFTNCAKKEEKGKIVIRYMRWADPSELASTKELLDLFMKKNPDIKVEFTTEAWGGYWNKLQTLIAANVPPDVFLLSVDYIIDFYKRGVLLNLTPLIENDKSLDLKDFFEPPFEIFTVNGNLYALPRDINAIVLYYNKDLFDEAGVEYPNEKWTWDDLVKAGKKLTKDLNNDGYIDQWGFITSLDFEVCWGNFVLQNNGKLLNEDKTKSLVNSPEVIEAIQFLYDLETKYKVAPNVTAKASLGDNVFLTGKVAMISDGSWRIGAYRSANFRWDIAMLPMKKKHACIANGVAHAISAKTKYQDAAWRLVKFLSDKEAQIALAKSGTSIPIRKSIAYSEYYLDGNPPGKINCLESIKYGYNYPVTEKMSEWLTFHLNNEIELAWLGKKTVQQAMNDAKKKIDKILLEAKKQ